MTVKIFNNDPKHWIYPVLTTGKGPEDIWMQAWWSVPEAALPKYPFTRRKNYRLYVNPKGTGIPPNTGVELTLPIFTQLVEPINAMPPAQPTLPSGGDTLINWWNGGVIQVYTSTTASPPLAITQALARATQKVVKSNVLGAVLPTCVVVPSAPTARPPSPPPCPQPLTIYSDDSDLAKNDPSQLIEYTFGARNDPKNVSVGPRYLLDTANVDFDVSYVNVAFAPAVMGPYKNDQVGYIGTPITIEKFNLALDAFLLAYPGWPQFLRAGQPVKKLASPLEVFARLGAKDPPPDLTQVPGWPGTWPASLWTPIQNLRTKWTDYAGKITAAPYPHYFTHTPGVCGPLRQPSPAPTNFCDTIVAVSALMVQNYRKYRALYNQGKCLGTPFDINDNLLISHVYGWAPWTESSTGKAGDGCKADLNLLENTQGYSTPIPPDKTDYTNYLNVKVAFDKLNYGLLPAKVANQIYTFNPWVQLIHRAPYINTPYAYAYSVDDAMGNIQAEGVGIIIDIGSTVNLENQLPASKPILVTLGGPDGFGKGIIYKAYALCKNTPAKTKNINPNFTTFALSGNNPANCPIYIYDSKTSRQLYAFKIDAKPDQFPYFENPADAKWLPGNHAKSTTKMVVCTGLPDAGPAQGYQQSSTTQCCDSASSSGVFAFAQPEPHDAHNTKKYIVNVGPPKPCTNDTDRACYAPNNPPTTKACNRGL